MKQPVCEGQFLNANGLKNGHFKNDRFVNNRFDNGLSAIERLEKISLTDSFIRPMKLSEIEKRTQR